MIMSLSQPTKYNKTDNDDDDMSTMIYCVETPFLTLRILEDLSSDDHDDDDDNDNDNDNEDGQLEKSIGRFVWPTALPLLRYLLTETTSTTSTTTTASSSNDNDNNNNSGSGNINFQSSSSFLIIELGAGCGVLGMGLAAAAIHHSHNNNNNNNTIHRHRHHHVLLTDHAEDWLERNVAFNHEDLMMMIDTNHSRTTVASMISVARLDWKNQKDIETVQNRIRDHLSRHDDRMIDVVLVGSDILYNHSSHGDLANTLYRLSQEVVIGTKRKSTCRILLGFPDRNDDETHFMPIAREFFGDMVSPSRPLAVCSKRSNNSNRNGRKCSSMELRVLDFYVR